MKRESVVAAIVAGGRGTRLGGVVKPLLMVGDRSILQRQVQALSRVFDRVMLVVGDPGPFQEVARQLAIDVVRDRVASGAGPLAGIDAALSALRPDEGAIFCVGGDMPFLQLPLLQLLRDERPAALAVAARVGMYPEPLFARYHRQAATTVARCLRQGRFKAADLLASLGADYLDEATLRAQDPELRSLFNINIPADLATAQTSGWA